VFPVIIAPAADTVVQTGAFTATLPGAWHRAPSPDASIYTRGDDALYITTTQLAADDDVDASASRIAEMRSKLIDDLARGDDTTSAVSRHANGRYFAGVDRRNGKRFFVAIVAGANAVISIAIYRPVSAPETGLNDLGFRVMESVTSPPAPHH